MHLTEPKAFQSSRNSCCKVSLLRWEKPHQISSLNLNSGGGEWIKKLDFGTHYGATAIYYLVVIAGFSMGVLRLPATVTMHLDSSMLIIALWVFLLYLSPLVNTLIRSKEIASLSFGTSVLANIVNPVFNVVRISPIQVHPEDILAIGIGFIATYALYMTKTYLSESSDE
jgi:hypothetical protein